MGRSAAPPPPPRRSRRVRCRRTRPRPTRAAPGRPGAGAERSRVRRRRAASDAERDDHERARQIEGTITARATRAPTAPTNRSARRIACTRLSRARRELLESGLLEEVFGRRHAPDELALAAERGRDRLAGTVMVRIAGSRHDPDRVVSGAGDDCTGERDRIGGVEAFLVVDPVNERRWCEIADTSLRRGRSGASRCTDGPSWSGQ